MKSILREQMGKMRRTHLYYKYTGFYTFVIQSLKKAIIPVLVVIGILVLLNAYVIDFGSLFVYITEHYAPVHILSVFLLTESFLGLVPPEIFIAWSHKMPQPVLYLSLLATMSYLGGIISYVIGKWIAAIPRVYEYLEVKMKQHLRHTRRWGGFLIVVGALLPIPYSMTCMAAGMINYKIQYLLLFGLLRYVRFYLYALAIFNLI